jgi:hypothetical protein
MFNELSIARRNARLNGPSGEESAGIAPYENTMGLGVGDLFAGWTVKARITASYAQLIKHWMDIGFFKKAHFFFLGDFV